ncbi:hypothetical protein F4808DRAFT_376046 [Astrocystis sublimbata]|nr:hypothetical protein F4808DRAFT_376046 [Astrocystis sublimbata]
MPMLLVRNPPQPFIHSFNSLRLSYLFLALFSPLSRTTRLLRVCIDCLPAGTNALSRSPVPSSIHPFFDVDSRHSSCLKPPAARSSRRLRHASTCAFVTPGQISRACSRSRFRSSAVWPRSRIT